MRKEHQDIPEIRVSSQDKLFKLQSSALGYTDIVLKVEPGATIIIDDADCRNLRRITLYIGQHANVWWLSQRMYDEIIIICQAYARISYMQYIDSIEYNSQKISVVAAENYSHIRVRIFPLVPAFYNICLSTLQHHIASHTQSDLKIVGVVGNQAEYTFRGMIQVDPGLDDISVTQKNSMVLEGPDCKASGQPSFSISSLRVNCAHGCAFGMLDKNLLWYAACRGIRQNDAQTMIINARCLQEIDAATTPETIYKKICSLLNPL
jgi:Fe-S cluster assembly scaffold protein SufB